MGLRINTNSAGVIALRNLRLADMKQVTSMERLSTGLRINRASDDPSGLVISEQLRAQITSLNQAVDNANNASNLVGTAEAAMAEINTLLVGIRESVIFAMNTGGTSHEQVQAEQDAVNSALAAIDRISKTTRFASTQLLNGRSGFDMVTTFPTTGLREVSPLEVDFDMTTSQTSFDVNVITQATHASSFIGENADVIAVGGRVTLRISGPEGTETITLATNSTGANLRDAINSIRANIGIFASTTALGSNFMFSELYGDTLPITIKQVDGDGNYPLTEGSFFGIDAVATVDGVTVTADGNRLNVVSENFTGRIELLASAEGGTAGVHTFTINNRSGLLFQLNTSNTAYDHRIIGIPELSTQTLGRAVEITSGIAKYGYLATLFAGGINDLFNTANGVKTVTDPLTMTQVPIKKGNALEVVDASIDKVSDVRGFLGAFLAQDVEPTIRSLGVAVENLTSSESDIRDLDFAAETAEFTKAQVLFQAGVSVMASANLIPQTVLQLLQ